jgi:hypothetical protein
MTHKTDLTLARMRAGLRTDAALAAAIGRTPQTIVRWRSVGPPAWVWDWLAARAIETGIREQPD